MQSFTSHLSNLKNKNLALHVFEEMARRGIDPNKFVHWYVTEARFLPENEIPKQAVQWFQDEYEKKGLQDAK